MANYNINKSDGTPFTINTGTINNTYDIPFIGQDAINYGDDLARANLRLLENFANVTAPAFGVSRIRGQLWYDTTPTTGRLNIYDGTSWDVIPLDVDVVHNTGAEAVAGIKTFSSAPAFTSAGAGFTVANNTLITNLNAAFLNGLTSAAFATAAQGILADNAEPDLPANTGADGYVLSSTLAGVYSWISPAVSAGQVDVTGPTIDTTTNVLLVDTTASGLQDPRYAAGLTYNASSGRLVTAEFQGNLIGTADLATNATTAASATTAVAVTISAATATDTTTYPVLVGAATATSQAPFIDNVDLSYNASTGALSAVSFVGSGAGLGFLNMSTGTHTGTLAVARGGTGVTTATGTGTAVVLHTTPTFATSIIAPLVNNATGVGVQFNASTQVITQDHTVTVPGNTTGAQVRHRDTNLYDIGLNQLPGFNVNVDDTLEAGHCGTMQIRTGTTLRTLTLAAVGDLDFPVGGITTIMDGATASTYTITEGASTTLYYITPGTGAVDTTGGCTIGPGGVATIWRSAADTYYIWGSEITA